MKCLVVFRGQSVLAIGLIIVSSCTIIQDGDITSAAQLEDLLESLTLQSFQIKQESLQGDAIVSVPRKYDSIKSVTDPVTLAKIVRKVEFTMPALGSLKLKLRSGSTGGTRLQAYYTDKKQLHTVRIIDRDSVVELYQFRYTTSGKLERVLTTINPYGDGLKRTVFTEDVLVYRIDRSDLVDRIDRSGTSTAGIDAQYLPRTNGGLSYEALINVIPPGQTNGNNNENCGSFDSNPQLCMRIASGNNVSFYCQVSTSEGGLIDEYLAVDNRGGPDLQTLRNFDTFFFHPTMVFTNEFVNGFYLSVIYSADWILKASTTAPSESFTEDDERVSFFLKYAL